ncbi:MAG: hypothetical protein FWD25_06480 [Clostridia bacterium]|nr:hypothetical protein [Clostridia bacterium]
MGKPRDYFEGWYFKHQSATDTVAIIPGRSKDAAFVQVITDGASYNVLYDLSLYEREPSVVRVGGSSFSLRRIRLDIQGKGIQLSGEVAYRRRTIPQGDIMGPFRFLPMECCHGLCSLHHELSGSLILNDREIDFAGGAGYIEKDSGYSFPKRYVWVQSTDFPVKCCVTLAVADIPLAGFRFLGLLCAIWYDGVEYRLATYNGARAVVCTRYHIVLQRGKQRLEVKIPKSCASLPLLAPMEGSMQRTIRESPSCPARFRFFDKGKLLFDMESPRASMEFCE